MAFSSDLWRIENDTTLFDLVRPKIADVTSVQKSDQGAFSPLVFRPVVECAVGEKLFDDYLSVFAH